MKQVRVEDKEDIQALINVMEANSGKIDRLYSQIESLREEAVKLCPVEIGDRVTSDYGYSFEGKEIEVYRIVFSKGNVFGRMANPHWILFGYVVKVDGVTGKNKGQKLLEVV